MIEQRSESKICQTIWKVYSINRLEKIKKLQLVHQTKLAELTNELESAMKDRIKKAEEGCKNAEDALEYEKSKFATRKQQLEDKHNSLNEKWRRDEETLHKDHEVQLSSIRSQRDQLQQQLTASSQSHTRALLELEDTYFQKSSASRENHAKESESQNAKITALSHQNNTLILQLNELRDTSEREKRQIEDRIKNSVNSLEAKLAEKERENNELKAAVKRLCSELDERDDEHVGKMKELQVAISTLITSGTRKHSSHLI